MNYYILISLGILGTIKTLKMLPPLRTFPSKEDTSVQMGNFYLSLYIISIVSLHL